MCCDRAVLLKWLSFLLYRLFLIELTDLLWVQNTLPQSPTMAQESFLALVKHPWPWTLWGEDWRFELLGVAFYAAISEGLICDCKMVRPMGFYLRSLKCLWFSQNPGSISNMVLTSVLDCPFLPRDLITGIPCRPHGVVEMLHIKTICAQQNSIKMESVIICVLQKSMVLPLEVRNTLHISPTSISNF